MDIGVFRDVSLLTTYQVYPAYIAGVPLVSCCHQVAPTSQVFSMQHFGIYCRDAVRILTLSALAREIDRFVRGGRTENGAEDSWNLLDP